MKAQCEIRKYNMKPKTYPSLKLETCRCNIFHCRL